MNIMPEIIMEKMRNDVEQFIVLSNYMKELNDDSPFLRTRELVRRVSKVVHYNFKEAKILSDYLTTTNISAEINEQPYIESMEELRIVNNECMQMLERVVRRLEHRGNNGI